MYSPRTKWRTCRWLPEADVLDGDLAVPRRFRSNPDLLVKRTAAEPYQHPLPLWPGRRHL